MNSSPDEQIEEFDTDDEESETVAETPVLSKIAAEQQLLLAKSLKPLVERESDLPLRINSNPLRPKIAEKRIKINIKTPLIIDAEKIQEESPKNDDEKVDEIVVEELKKEEEKIEEKQNAEFVPPDYAKHLSYEGSLCIYTEPGTGRQLIWNANENAWVSREEEKKLSVGEDSENLAEAAIKDEELCGLVIFAGKNNRESCQILCEIDETDFDVSFRAPSFRKDNSAATAGLETVVPGGIYGFEGDTHTYTDPNDGSVYLWDREKSAWFPKVIYKVLRIGIF